MTAYELRISDWSSDVCSSDLRGADDFAVRIVAADLRDDRRDLGRGAAVVLDADARDAASDRPDAALVQAARGRLADDDHRPLVAGLHACVDRVDGGALRSEERRVGKEGFSRCRTRWLPYP